VVGHCPRAAVSIRGAFTAVRNCTRDEEEGPFEVGNHGVISSRCKLLRSKAVVVSVAERVVVVTAKAGSLARYLASKALKEHPDVRDPSHLGNL
jgi:hypothetical protein